MAEEFKKIDQETEKELKDFLNGIQTAVKFRFIGYFGFSALTLVLKLLGLYPTPWSVFFILLFLSFFTFLWSRLFKKIKNNIGQLSVIYFFLQAIEIILILTTIHFSQITAFAGALILVIYFLHAQFPYTKKVYSWATLAFCIVAYSVTIILEYSGIIKTVDIHHFGITIEHNRGLFILSLPMSVSLMFFISLVVDAFSKKLKESLKMLIQKETELEEAKIVLEIKVKARTQEIEQEKVSLEQRVQERTKALQNKINELEKFQGLSVGRELKMVELKEGMELLRKELEKIKKQ